MYSCDKYYTTSNNVIETLNTHGVAIIPGILDQNECEKSKDGMWNMFEHVSKEWEVPMNRNNLESWKEIEKLHPYRNMLLHFFQVGHSQFVWDLRQNKKIVDVFSNIWKTDPADLLVSFDGLSVNLPPEVTGVGWKGDQPHWLHVDQSYNTPGFQCVQGFVTPYEVCEGDATFVFLDGSHRYFKDVRDVFNITKVNEFTMLEEKHIDYYKSRGCVEKRLTCPAGSLILWDSRTIHCNMNAEESREKQNIRCAVYLSYSPRNSCIQSDILDRKITLFENRIMTSHHANRTRAFPPLPYEYDESIEMTSFPIPELSSLGRRLVGYNS